MTEDRWYKFTERHPENRQTILVYVEDKRGGEPYMSTTPYIEGVDLIFGGKLWLNNTLYAEYWRKLPKAPK
jgi:hypothetical protein